MADFSALKTAIQNNIKQNGNEEITGSILQQILLAIVDTLGDSAINGLITDLSNEVTARQNADTLLQQGINSEASTRGSADTQLQNNINSEANARSTADGQLQTAINAIHTQIDNGYVYAGIATPSTSPATGKVFYIAVQAGTYTNFGSTVVTEGITILRYVGSAWVKEQLIYADGGVFDVTAQNGGATFASLEALMSDANLSTLIPTAVRKGGMSIKFVCTSDNKYVQYRLMLSAWSTNINNWQGVDDRPAVGSNNLITSGGVARRENDIINYINNVKPSVCVDDSEAEFNIVDFLGYVLAQFKDGHIKTKNFDSRNILTMLNKYTRFSYTQQDGIFIADENGYVLLRLDNSSVSENIIKGTIQDGLFISDERGNVYVDFSKGMKTKYFDGRSMYPGQINKDTGTLTGCINKAYDMIHTKWPTAQVFVCSIMKIGRTMADANASYLTLNSLGLSKNQYNKRIKECAELAGFYYIDLWGEMGIDPLNAIQAEIFFHNAQEIADRGVDPARINDRVHPIQAGHKRMAEVIYNHLVNAAGVDGWQGKKAIFFGDSITDNLNGMHTDKVYYSYLTDWLQLRDDGMSPNGYSTKNTVHYPQNAGAYGTGYKLEWAGQGNLYERIPDYNDDYDLVVILLGTNDTDQVLGDIYNY